MFDHIRFRPIADIGFEGHSVAMSEIDFTSAQTPCLSLSDGYDAMRHFLEAYWERGDRSSDDIAVLLGSLNRDVTRDGGPVDAAQWDDWLKAIGKVMWLRSDNRR